MCDCHQHSPNQLIDNSHLCGAGKWIDGHHYVCEQQSHPSGRHHGKRWNRQTREYVIVSWEAAS